LLFQPSAKGGHPFITIAIFGHFPIKPNPIGDNMDVLLLGIFMQDADILVIRNIEFFGRFPAYFNKLLPGKAIPRSQAKGKVQDGFFDPFAKFLHVPELLSQFEFIAETFVVFQHICPVLVLKVVHPGKLLFHGFGQFNLIFQAITDAMKKRRAFGYLTDHCK
jgi:hypothetical protein